MHSSTQLLDLKWRRWELATAWWLQRSQFHFATTLQPSPIPSLQPNVHSFDCHGLISVQRHTKWLNALRASQAEFVHRLLAIREFGSFPNRVWNNNTFHRCTQKLDARTIETGSIIILRETYSGHVIQLAKVTKKNKDNYLRLTHFYQTSAVWNKHGSRCASIDEEAPSSARPPRETFGSKTAHAAYSSIKGYVERDGGY